MNKHHKLKSFTKNCFDKYFNVCCDDDETDSSTKKSTEMKIASYQIIYREQRELFEENGEGFGGQKKYHREKFFLFVKEYFC